MTVCQREMGQKADGYTTETISLPNLFDLFQSLEASEMR